MACSGFIAGQSFRRQYIYKTKRNHLKSLSVQNSSHTGLPLPKPKLTWATSSLEFHFTARRILGRISGILMQECLNKWEKMHLFHYYYLIKVARMHLFHQSASRFQILAQWKRVGTCCSNKHVPIHRFHMKTWNHKSVVDNFIKWHTYFHWKRSFPTENRILHIYFKLK